MRSKCVLVQKERKEEEIVIPTSRGSRTIPCPLAVSAQGILDSEGNWRKAAENVSSLKMAVPVMGQFDT